MLGAWAFPFDDLAGFFLGMPPVYRVAAFVLAAIFFADLVAIGFELRRLARKRRRAAPVPVPRRPLSGLKVTFAFACAAAFVLGICLFLARPPELPTAEADNAPEAPSLTDVSPQHPAADPAAAIADALKRVGPQTIRVIEGGDDPGAAVDLPKWRAILKQAGWTAQDGGQIQILDPPGGVVVAIGLRPELTEGGYAKPQDLPLKARVLLAALYAQGIPAELRMTQLFMLRDDAILVVCGRALPDAAHS